jgi:hypothetical protein
VDPINLALTSHIVKIIWNEPIKTADIYFRVFSVSNFLMISNMILTKKSPRQPRTISEFHIIPPELLDIIISYFVNSYLDLVRLSHISEEFNHLTSEDSRWMSYLFNDFPTIRNKIENNYRHCYLQLKHGNLFTPYLEGKKELVLANLGNFKSCRRYWTDYVELCDRFHRGRLTPGMECVRDGV